MKHWIRLTWLVCLQPMLPVALLFAQPSEFSVPPGITMGLQPVNIPGVFFPPVDVKKLLAEDSVDMAHGAKPFRFGYDFYTDITPENSGTWIPLKGKSRLWQVKISCTQSLSINLLFHDYEIAPGCRVWVYSEDGTQILGAFTNKNNYDHKNLATGIIKGSSLIVEMLVPRSVHDYGVLRIERVTHGYKNIPMISREKDFGDSGSCNNNVNCPVGAPWTNEKRAVAAIVDGGRICTGALVNNTLQDGTPYFLSANHCYGSVGSWAFMFNYESLNCTNIDGPVNQVVSGSVLRAKNAQSDFLLLELSSIPPPSYNVYYLGWDNSGTQPTSQVCIHHPNGDIKKITFDNDPATATTWSSAQVWEIGNWESGTTEPASSGSPLFDQNHRVIGQLYGGTASCTNISDDNFGRFDVSWDYGSTSATRLKEWLDPGNSGVTVLDGYDPNVASDSLDAGLNSIGSPSGVYCNENSFPLVVTVRNYGIDTLFSLAIAYTVDATITYTYLWNGSLPSMANQDVTLDTLFLSGGSHTVVVETSLPNGAADEDSTNNMMTVTFDAVVGPVLTVGVKTDDYGSETTWELRDAFGALLGSGGPYSDYSQQTYTQQVCATYGCNLFSIFDAYGDGICCSYGQGGFWVLDENNDTLFAGGQFTNADSVTLCFSLPFPAAQFSVNDASVCEGDTVVFTDLSSGSPDTYLWIFEGGTPPTSTLPDPVVFYDSLGAYDVTLIVSNSNGSDTMLAVDYMTVDSCTVVIAPEEYIGNFNAYPNPFSVRADLHFGKAGSEGVFILYDVAGHKIMEKEFQREGHLVISRGALNPGIYFFRAVSVDGRYQGTGKLVIE